MNTNTNTYKNQKGQTLLFVVVAMTIALSIGINASVRTLTSLSRTSRTDTASRALAAAEGGIERYLVLSSKELRGAADDGDCPEGTPASETGPTSNGPPCKIRFEDMSDNSDNLVSLAFVTVENYTPTDYLFSLESGQVKEVNLYDEDGIGYYSSNQIRICWTSTSGGSDITYVSYNESGIQEKGGLEGNPQPEDGYVEEGFDKISTSDGTRGGSGTRYEVCYNVTIGDDTDDIYGLRIRSIGGASDIEVSPEPVTATLPLQGYKITSVGKLEQDSEVTATRVIRVIKSLPYLPVSFDYALYSQGPVNK